MTPVGDKNAALVMDEGIPLGNSEDVFTKRSLHVKIGNKPTEPIPVFMSESFGVEICEYQTALTAFGGGSVTALSVTVPAAVTWYVSSVHCSCSQPVKFTIKKASSVLGVRRTTPAGHDSDLIFEPKFPIIGGTVLTVVVTSQSFVPQCVVDVTLMASEI